MKLNLCSGGAVWLVAALAGAIIPSTGRAQVAGDNADIYPGNPDHGWSANNGGLGYDLWTPLGDTAGGGTYMEGVGVNNRQVDGNYSFALYAGGGAYDISRPITSPYTQAEFTISTRFDLAGAGPNLVNLRSGNSIASFGAGELISFGIVNDNQLSYTDLAGTHVLGSGEARGQVWDWTIDFNANSGAFSLSVTNAGGGFATSVAGTLEISGTTAGSFAVINSSTGGNQNLIFDSPQFQPIPEPTAVTVLGLGLVLGGVHFMRRRKA